MTTSRHEAVPLPPRCCCHTGRHGEADCWESAAMWVRLARGDLAGFEVPYCVPHAREALGRYCAAVLDGDAVGVEAARL